MFYFYKIVESKKNEGGLHKIKIWTEAIPPEIILSANIILLKTFPNVRVISTIGM